MKFVGNGPGKDDPHFNTFWFARLSGIVMILPASMAAGWLLGYYVVDRYITSFPWGTIALTLIGAGAGFFEIVRILVSPGGKRDRSIDGKD
jgi:F0F1-type ATP synthase assembly protein I